MKRLNLLKDYSILLKKKLILINSIEKIKVEVLKSWDHLNYLITLSKKSWVRLSCLITIIGGTFFILTTIIAMFFYPGSYNFATNFFSDLGMTSSSTNHEPNPISSVLFLLACTVVGASLIPFWIVMTRLFSEVHITKYISYLGSIAGLISSVLLMGVGIFPMDTAILAHFISAGAFFISLSIAIIIYSIAIFLDKNYRKIYGFIGIGFSLFIILYLCRVFFLIDPLAQKIVVYGYITWAVFQLSKIWKLKNKINRI